MSHTIDTETLYTVREGATYADGVAFPEACRSGEFGPEWKIANPTPDHQGDVAVTNVKIGDGPTFWVHPGFLKPVPTRRPLKQAQPGDIAIFGKGADPSFARHRIGDRVTVTGIVADPTYGGGFGVNFEGDVAAWGASWFEDYVEVAPEALIPTRPTVDFSTDGGGYGIDRSKAREYAASLVSRVNKPETNDVLQAVEAGDAAVDALRLNAAVTDAMRHVATRFGQSTQRREMGKRVAHLAHIAQAVIENHADGLPAYESGERSRKVAALEEELGRANQARVRLESDLESRVDALREAQANLDIARAEIERERAVLAFAQGFLSDSARHRVEGFRAGYEARPTA